MRGLLAVALLLCLPASAAAHARRQVVQVTITDTRCSVAPGSVGFGNTHFVVRNRGRRSTASPSPAVARGRCAIIGGVVARDPRLPSLEGHFLFADLCDGRVRRLYSENGFALVRDVGLTVPSPITFGVDGRGRVYGGSATGEVFRLDPATPAARTR